MKFISPITICNKIYKKYYFLFYEKEQTYLFNKLYLNKIDDLKIVRNFENYII